MLQGVRVLYEHHNLHRFALGARLLLLLTYNVSDGLYRIVGGVHGAFQVHDGAITPLLRPAAGLEHLAGARFEFVLAEIARVRSAMP